MDGLTDPGLGHHGSEGQLLDLLLPLLLPGDGDPTGCLQIQDAQALVSLGTEDHVRAGGHDRALTPPGIVVLRGAGFNQATGAADDDLLLTLDVEDLEHLHDPGVDVLHESPGQPLDEAGLLVNQVLELGLLDGGDQIHQTAGGSLSTVAGDGIPDALGGITGQDRVGDRQVAAIAGDQGDRTRAPDLAVAIGPRVVVVEPEPGTPSHSGRETGPVGEAQGWV